MNAWDLLWYLITQLGSDYFYVAALTIIYLGFNRKLGKKLATIELSNIWLSAFLKDFFKIPRPPRELWKYQVEGYGFPSGHTQGTTVFWGYLSLYFSSVLLLIVAVLILLLVAYSRLELGVHSLLDVVGGAFFGSLVLFLGFLVEKEVVKKIKNYVSFVWVSLPLLFFAISFVSGYGGKDAALTTGAFFGMAVGFAYLKESIEEKPNFKVGTLNVVVGAPSAFIAYFFASKTQALLVQFLVMSLAGLVISLLPFLVEKARAARARETQEQARHQA
ncbi:MAG: phosphatase PAP2 family protein [Thaumarchaeota archaeon]|nr:phosphatase PAP2 family protein [Nitrososphaerota archaeon]